MKLLPTNWERAEAALGELTKALADYALARQAYVKQQGNLAELWQTYQDSITTLKQSHNTWKKSMSDMIQGRQL